jgi:hypothetical protein
LAQLASIVSSGHELPLSPEVRDDEEWRKKITSLLIADSAVIIIDNVERTLRSGQLAAALTTSEWTDRILGKSEVLHLHSRAIWIATGNNIRLGGDIGRRAYWIRLNANLPRPWLRDSRDFKRELPAWAIRHRAEMVVALLTMARAWFLNDKPAWSGRPLGSYETWSRIVGGILEFCGVKQFLSNLEELYDQTDDEFIEWNSFMSAIFETFGTDTAFSTKALMERISSESPPLYGREEHNVLKTALPESLGDMRDRGFSKRLGLALKKRKDQIFEMGEGFIKLKEALPDRHRKQTRWQLRHVSGDVGVGENTAVCAGSAGCSNAHPRNEKEIPGTPTGKEEELISFQEGTAELPAHTALPAKEEPFVFEDDPEERAAIQAESQKDGGARDGENADVGVGKNTAVCAGRLNGHPRNEKEIPSTPSGNEEELFIAFREGAAELPAHTALPAKEEPFVFEDDPEERAAIQAESQRNRGTRDGETQVK